MSSQAIKQRLGNFVAQLRAKRAAAQVQEPEETVDEFGAAPVVTPPVQAEAAAAGQQQLPAAAPAPHGSQEHVEQLSQAANAEGVMLAAEPAYGGGVHAEASLEELQPAELEPGTGPGPQPQPAPSIMADVVDLTAEEGTNADSTAVAAPTAEGSHEQAATSAAAAVPAGDGPLAAIKRYLGLASGEQQLQYAQEQQEQQEQQASGVPPGHVHGGVPPLPGAFNPLLMAQPIQTPAYQQQQQLLLQNLGYPAGFVPPDIEAGLNAVPLPAVLREKWVSFRNGHAVSAQQAQQVHSELAAQQQQQQQRARRLPHLLGGEAAGMPGIRAPAANSAAAPPATVVSKDKAAAVKVLLDGLAAGQAEEQEPPEGMLLVPMLRHQRVALGWMCRREVEGKQPRGGILADDQGLGKTVSTISLIVTNRPQVRLQGQPAAPPSTRKQQQQQQSRKRPRATDGISPSPSARGSSKDGSISGGSSIDEYPSSSEEESGADQAAAAANLAGGAAVEGTSSGASMGVKPEVVCLDCSEDEEFEVGERGSGRLQGGTLVVCPTTVLHQWASEVRTKVSPHAGISVHVYHGKGKEVSAQTLSRYSVVLTTYQTMALDAPQRQGGNGKTGKKQGTPGPSTAVAVGAANGAQEGPDGGDGMVDLLSDEEEDAQAGAALHQPATKRQKAAAGKAAALAKKAGKASGPLYQIMWHRVVLDEAQCIKNPRTLAAHAAWSLKASSRWCLSGTPLQNSVEDLYSYFRFLKYEPYSRQATFKELLRDPIAAGGVAAEKGFKRLQAVLQQVLMRRTKASQIDGKPIIELPPRLQEHLRARMSPEERRFYLQLKEQAGEEIKRLRAQGGGMGQQYVGVLWQLLRLRQACNHPLLVKGMAQKQAVPPAELAAARRLPPHMRGLLADLLRPHRLTPCAVCGDVPEDAVASLCQHIFCRQCVATEVSNAGQGAAEAELAFHCPACRHALGKHDTYSMQALQAAASPAREQQEQQQQQQQQQGLSQALPDLGIGNGGSGANGSTTPTKWHTSAKLDALMGLLRTLRDKGAAAEAEAQQRRSVLLPGRSLSHARLAAALGGGSRMPQRGVGAGGSGGSAGSSRGSSPRLPMEKVIVFSQWTAMLDLAEGPLRREKFQFRRLDGTMSIKTRQEAIDDFCKRPEVSVMLVSLKAASLGVNLVAANHVVLLDLWFNPTVEEQAIDRAHRIGQTRPVHVTRITIEDSVEDKILELQERKRGVIAAALGEDGTGSGVGLSARLTAEDLNYLFADI